MVPSALWDLSTPLPPPLGWRVVLEAAAALPLPPNNQLPIPLWPSAAVAAEGGAPCVMPSQLPCRQSNGHRVRNCFAVFSLKQGKALV